MKTHSGTNKAIGGVELAFLSLLGDRHRSDTETVFPRKFIPGGSCLEGEKISDTLGGGERIGGPLGFGERHSSRNAYSRRHGRKRKGSLRRNTNKKYINKKLKKAERGNNETGRNRVWGTHRERAK